MAVPKEDKYVVYANDLKYKSLRKIDPSKAEWYTDDVEEMHEITNCDSLAFRLDESKKNNYQFLDLSGLGLSEIPSFTNYPNYDKLRKIKFLFLNDNKLVDLGNGLNQFDNLEVLDVAKNKLVSLNSLPVNLTELSCHNNKLVSIVSHHKLVKIDCSHNDMKTINKHDSLATLICEFNQLESVNTYPSLKWLTCKHNPLTKINKQLHLKYLDCSYTNLTGHIVNFPSLAHLMCNGTKVSSLDDSLNLKSLEIAGSLVRELPYYPELKDLIFKCDDKLFVPLEYKIKEFHKEHSTGYIEFCT
jgi:Leucine-rich repeat (LRR) protein